MDIFKKQFGPKLKVAIKNANLTQSEFAERMGVEQATVSRWCSGKDLPNDDRLPEIMRVLKLSESYFLEGSVTVGFEMSEIIELLSLWEKADPLLRTAIMNTLKKEMKAKTEKAKAKA